MSTEFHEGDLVEAVKGDHVTRGRVTTLPSTGELCLPRSPEDNSDQWTFLAWLERPENGYTVTLKEKAAPPLPTADGWYATDFESNLLSLFDGKWVEHSASRSWPRDDEYARECLKRPFTRLGYESDTVEQVLDAVRSRKLHVQTGLFSLSDVLDAVAVEFGVAE